VAVDRNGNAFVADRENHLIRKISPSGVVSTFAGGLGSAGYVDGTGTTARFNKPYGLAVDSSGDLYVADYSNHLIRKISAAGVVSTLAGTSLTSGFGNGTAGTASFYNPTGVAVDTNGQVYVADYNNHLIRKISPAGVVSTLAGSAGASGFADGTGSAATFNNPSGVAVDSSGVVYVADYNNHLIRKISPAGGVSSWVGVANTSGYLDGAGATAKLNHPAGVAVDASGYAYVTDTSSHVIRRVTPQGVVSTIAGSAGNGGYADGTGGLTRFSYPNGITLDASGILYVSEGLGQRICKITPI
jgi:streptogramin lyase